MKNEKCVYCGRKAIHQLKNKKWCCHASPNSCPERKKKNSKANKGKERPWVKGNGFKKGAIPWNKGKTKEEDIRMARPQQKGKKFGASLIGHSKETKKKLSNIAKSRKLGGYVQGSGRGKAGWYKNIYCDSSWELAYVLYCESHFVDISRCEEVFEYFFEGKLRKYKPDFWVNSEYVEIKGYKTEQWLAKLDQFPHKLNVLYESDMKPIIDFVESKHGKNFVELYE